MRVFLYICVMVTISFFAFLRFPETKHIDTQKTKDPYPVEQVQRDIRNVTPEYALPGPYISKDTISRLPAIVIPPPPKIEIKQKNSYSVVVLSAGILKSREAIIHIAGIKPLVPDAQCADANGGNWPCGRFARTALRGLIGSRKISCEKFEASDTISTKCKVGNRDIGSWLVRQGWADAEGESYLVQMAHARQSGLGKWNKNGP